MRKNVKNIIIVSSFFLLLGSIGFLNIISPDKEISVSERRALAGRPKLSIKGITNGTYFQALDNYMMDQFVFREEFRKLKINWDLKMMGNYNNISLKNGYIYERLYPIDEASVKNFVKKINALITSYLSLDNKIYYTIIPDKSYYIDDDLKLDYQTLEKMTKDIKGEYISLLDKLSLEDYYKTDTHWREERLADVSKYLALKMGTSLDDDISFEELGSFLGVYASRILLSNSDDKIYVLKSKYLDDVLGKDMITEENINLYDKNKINSLDKYDIYLGGSKALIELLNPLSKSDKELIVFRDSYASSLIPLMISGYKKIVLVDTRYISPKVINKYIEFTNQDVLFIYGGLMINNSYTIR